MAAFRTTLLVFALGFLAGLACFFGVKSLANKETQIHTEMQMRIANDRDYNVILKNDIQSANESILVAMYEMKYDLNQPTDPVNILCLELVYAKREE